MNKDELISKYMSDVVSEMARVWVNAGGDPEGFVRCQDEIKAAIVVEHVRSLKEWTSDI